MFCLFDNMRFDKSFLGFTFASFSLLLAYSGNNKQIPRIFKCGPNELIYFFSIISAELV